MLARPETPLRRLLLSRDDSGEPRMSLVDRDGDEVVDQVAFVGSARR